MNRVERIAVVRFINRERNTYSKEYYYKLNNNIINRLFQCGIKNKVCNTEVYKTFTIKNSNNYDYRGSEVIFTGIIFPSTIEKILSLEELTYIIEVNEISTFTTRKAIDNEREYDLNIEKKEVNMFKKMMKNIEFGKVEDLEMSMYGPSFKSDAGSRISYDSKKKEWVDVTGLTFDYSMAYKMPVAIKDIKPNDFILHQGLWVRVVEVSDNIMVEKIFEREVSFIMPVKNMFGFNFVTKLVYFDFGQMISNEVNEDNPFGTMLPLLMMKDSDSDMLLMLMMMQNDKGAPTMDFNNPMMMYMMMKDSDSDMLPMLMMMQNMNK